MKLTYVIQMYKSMFPFKNGIINIINLHTDSQIFFRCVMSYTEMHFKAYFNTFLLEKNVTKLIYFIENYIPNPIENGIRKTNAS